MPSLWECTMDTPKVYHMSIEGECEYMVIVQVKTKGSNEWVRDSFLNPIMYMKWREYMGKRIVSVKPVGKAVRTYA